MAWTKESVFTALSAVYLVILTGVAAYALHTIRIHSLPIPHILGAFTLALPAIAGLVVEVLAVSVKRLREQSAQKPNGDGEPLYRNVTILLLFIYDTVVATLVGTYIAPVSTLHCGLEDKWQELWHKRDGKAIRRIQDAFECCGLHSSVDKAFPFPSKGVGVDGCKKTFGWETSCFGVWREEERKVAGLMLMVVSLVGIWKILVILSPGTATSWSNRREQDAENQTNGQGTLEYPVRDGGEYRDDPEEINDSDEEEEAESRRLLGDVENTSHLREDQEEWARERAGS